MEVMVSWYGPYVFVPQAGFECVFECPETMGPGLYLWTVEHKDGYLVNYVGETGESLRKRLAQGVQWSLGGNDGVVSEPAQFRQGRRFTLAKFSFQEFLADSPRLSAAIYENYRAYRVFVAPVKVDSKVRKYIEAGIIRALRAADPKFADFLCNRHLTGASPSPLSVRFATRQPFHGLEALIKC